MSGSTANCRSGADVLDAGEDDSSIRSMLMIAMMSSWAKMAHGRIGDMLGPGVVGGLKQLPAKNREESFQCH